MKYNNFKLKKLLKESKIHQYQIAEKLGISEFTFVRKLRKELSQNEADKVLSIINSLQRAKEKKHGE